MSIINYKHFETIELGHLQCKIKKLFSVIIFYNKRLKMQGILYQSNRLSIKIKFWQTNTLLIAKFGRIYVCAYEYFIYIF